MSIKVKVLSSYTEDALERGVNEFLDRIVPERSFVDIKYSTSAYYGDGEKEELYSAMIIYKQA